VATLPQQFFQPGHAYTKELCNLILRADTIVVRTYDPFPQVHRVSFHDYVIGKSYIQA